MIKLAGFFGQNLPIPAAWLVEYVASSCVRFIKSSLPVLAEVNGHRGVHTTTSTVTGSSAERITQRPEAAKEHAQPTIPTEQPIDDLAPGLYNLAEQLDDLLFMPFGSVPTPRATGRQELSVENPADVSSMSRRIRCLALCLTAEHDLEFSLGSK